MPISKGIYTCKTCNENFEAKNDAFYTCPCGESEIKVSDLSHTGYSYKNRNTVDVVEGTTYYLPEEFEPLSDIAQQLYDEIKQIKEATGYKYYIHEYSERGQNGERFLSHFSIETHEHQSRYNSGTNALRLYINLCKTNYSSVSPNIEERLERFLGFIKQIEDGTLKLGKISTMQQIAEKYDLEESKEQVEEYDYTYHV